MDKMIDIINHNLEAIINGIKTHKERTEKALKLIENEIKSKIKIANNFKSQIDESKEVIANLENEILDLEDDLKELNEKFGSKNFIEILSVGNKEINNKISEKKALINEQNAKIMDYTKKCEEVKVILEELNKKKDLIVKTLSESSVLEKYYCKKISIIVDFAKEHKNDLDNYIEEDQLTIDITDVEEEQLLTVVDDSVFKELDDYTSIISSANEIIEKSKEVEEHTTELTNELKIVEEQKQENTYIPVETPSEENVIDLFIDPEGLEDKQVNPENLYAFGPFNIIPTEVTDTKVGEEPASLDEIQNNIENETKEESVFKQITDMVFDKSEFLDYIPENNINISELQSAFTPSEAPFSVELEQCGLNIELFDIEDRIKLQTGFNKQNTIDFLNVMIKHRVNTNIIYHAVDTLLEVTPQTLDEILSLLKKANVSSSNIEYVFGNLNNINVSKLEKAIDKAKDKQLIELLYEATDKEPVDQIAKLIELNDDEAKKLKKSATADEYKMMNLFPGIVICNYNTIKSLKTDNLNECFTKHPKRFLLNPEALNEILDKYDLDDLIRCINKNAAVIDKL